MCKKPYSGNKTPRFGSNYYFPFAPRGRNRRAFKAEPKNPIPVYHDHRFRERDFGSLSGKPMEEIKKLAPSYDEDEKTKLTTIPALAVKPRSKSAFGF